MNFVSVDYLIPINYILFYYYNLIMSDIIIGVQYGDEGKGKVTEALMKKKEHSHCARYNGGPNAGHTIYVNGKKLVTHQVPTGIIHGMKCLIGPCCVIDIEKLEQEIVMLEEHGVKDVRKNLKIAHNAHIISKKHIQEDIANDMSGSTHCGIRPVYRDKYDRCGTRAETFNQICGCEIVNSYKELSQPGTKVLFEGAQGFMLDIDWGHYPFVTSSHCTSTVISSCGYPFKKIRNVYGIAKIYETYVGKMEYQGPDPELVTLGQLGHEYGATTGRLRQCNWFNLDTINMAVTVNSVTHLIINKCDIIEQLGVFKLIHNDTKIEFETLEKMKEYINANIIDPDIEIIYSYHKDRI